MIGVETMLRRYLRYCTDYLSLRSHRNAEYLIYFRFLGVPSDNYKI